MQNIVRGMLFVVRVGAILFILGIAVIAAYGMPLAELMIIAAPTLILMGCFIIVATIAVLISVALEIKRGGITDA